MRFSRLIFLFLVFPMYGFATPYTPPLLLSNGHVQTIYAAKISPVPQVNYLRQRWELPDGDFVDVDWVSSTFSNNNAPVLALFHGLEGSSQSTYAKTMMAKAESLGWRGLVIHFRGCSGEPNRLSRVYYAGDSEEINLLLTLLRNSVGNKVPVYVAGFSLGGNALLKWLGEHAKSAHLLVSKAAAVSATIDLAAAADTLDSGINRLVYTPQFVSTMRPKALLIAERFPSLLDSQKILAAKTIHDIDTSVTAILYGAKSAQDYYEKNSAKPWLKYIQIPTLILNAKNDPFYPAEKLAKPSEVSNNVTLEYPDSGGHVGFVSYNNWLASHLIQYFETH